MFAFMAILWAVETAAAPAPAAPAQAHLAPDIAWASATTDDDRFWIRAEDVRSQYYPATVTVWIHGEHGYNHHVAYKKSLQEIRFFCNGTMQLIAQTTTDAEGRNSEWRGAGSVDRIGKGTVYQDMERAVCSGDLAAK